MNLHLHDVTCGYRDRPVIANINLDIPLGTLITILGSNASGKSTVCQTIAARLRPLAGRIRYVGGKRSRIAYLPQKSFVNPDFPIDVRDFVSMGLWNQIGYSRRITATMTREIENACAMVGLENRLSQLIGYLSGGQLQRLYIARLILQASPVLVLDEPFLALDRHASDILRRLIEQWHGEGRTVIIATHDVTIFRTIGPQTLVLDNGRCIWDRTPQTRQPATSTSVENLTVPIYPRDPKPSIRALPEIPNSTGMVR